MKHSFAFTLKTPRTFKPEYLGELSRAGCHDALLTFEGDALQLEFDREADTFYNALSAALKQVRSVQGFRIQRVNLVGQRD